MNRIVVAAALLALIPAVAIAHAQLRSATPGVGSTVSAPPTEVAIDFSEGVEPAFSTIAVLDPAGAHVEAGAAHVAQGNNMRLIVPVGALKPGTYTVEWHATAVDTHKTQGKFAFTVGG